MVKFNIGCRVEIKNMISRDGHCRDSHLRIGFRGTVIGYKYNCIAVFWDKPGSYYWVPDEFAPVKDPLERFVLLGKGIDLSEPNGRYVPRTWLKVIKDGKDIELEVK